LSLEQEQFEQRFARIREIEALGSRPYGQRFDFTHTVPQIWAEYGAKTAAELDAARVPVRLPGRILTIRRMGKAGFMHLQQGGAKLQVYVKKDALSEAGFQLYQLLDLGDVIGVEGYLFRTRTGELSVHVDQLVFLSKNLLGIPEKYHGLEDVELRYRQRYLDLIANPEVLTVFAARARVVGSLRRQLESRGFIEVETPMMQSLYGGAAARPFVTHHNALDIDLYLRIAPELYLKRLVAGGMDSRLRDQPQLPQRGRLHAPQPEFTMLEFYQAYTDYRGLMDLNLRAVEAARHRCHRRHGCRIPGPTARLRERPPLHSPRGPRRFWSAPGKPSLDQVRDPAWLALHSNRPTPAKCWSTCLNATPSSICSSRPSFTNTRSRSRRWPSRIPTIPP